MIMKHVDIYTDGACRGNPGRGGWGAILVYGGVEKELSGGERETTNNRMELTAVISALQALREPCEVTLTSDSKYVIDAITKGWALSWRAKGWRKADKSPALNVDLWEVLLGLLEKHKVDFVWVHGHTGHPYNERCDVLATTFADSFL
jgi:ribonuclease HI